MKLWVKIFIGFFALVSLTAFLNPQDTDELNVWDRLFHAFTKIVVFVVGTVFMVPLQFMWEIATFWVPNLSRMFWDAFVEVTAVYIDMLNSYVFRLIRENIVWAMMLAWTYLSPAFGVLFKAFWYLGIPALPFFGWWGIRKARVMIAQRAPLEEAEEEDDDTTSPSPRTPPRRRRR